jgi:hypothetical protein
MDESRIFRIVLTGGPCGGKSTALSSVSERLKDHGFDVCQIAGLPEPLEIERKFLLGRTPAAHEVPVRFEENDMRLETQEDR